MRPESSTADRPSVAKEQDQNGGDRSEHGGDPGAVDGEPERTEQQRAPTEALAHQYRGGALPHMRSPEFHSVPLVEGMASRARGSSSTAMRSARAVALKQASATWWAL